MAHSKKLQKEESDSDEDSENENMILVQSNHPENSDEDMMTDDDTSEE